MRFAGARIGTLWAAGLAVVLAAVPGPPAAADSARAAELLRAGYQHAYNLDFDEALAAFRRAVEADPENPAVFRAVASVTWLNLMFARGALSSDEFLSSLPENNAAVKPPPADVVAVFRANVDKAIELSEAQIRRRPRDADAHYNLGSARGLLAAYTVSVEGSLFGAVGLARSAFKATEQVLVLDPSRKDAEFFTGSYRYAVANLGSVKRWLAYLAGFSGDRERAVRMLEESAAYPSDVQADARILLVLVYSKERRYDDALRLLEGLRRDFPRNRLLWLESGAAEMRARRPARALEYFDAGLAMFDRDPRLKAFGEEALWYAKRGAALAGTGDRARAEADLRKAVALPGRDWVHGRCRLELGKLADLAGNRTAAVIEYRQAAALCAKDRDPVGRDEAARWLAAPFSGTNTGPARQ